MDRQTADFYAKNATPLSIQYQQTSDGHMEALDLAFAGARSVLDVGCGTGRDAAYLLKRGKDVIGIDGSEAMLAKARQTFAAAKLDPEGRLHQAALPDLEIFEDRRFDGLLCNAVLMHLPEESLFDTVYSLKRVLRPGGTVLFTIPETRPGIDPKTHRDADGRLYTGLPAAKLQLLFERVGFRLESSEVVNDPFGRDGYTWNRSVLTRLDDSVARPLHLVERILNRDDKVATYKLALFRALAEIAQTQHHLASFLPDGKVSLPVAALAEKWLLYYWPIFDAAETHPIRQGTSSQGADVAIRAPMQKVIREYSNDGGLSRFYVEWKSNRLTAPVDKLVRSALGKLRSTIWSMPAKHAGGGHFTVFQYDRPAKSLIMEAALWRELCLMGSWIQDATVLRWAELTEQINKGAVKTSEVVERLLTVPNAARNVADARAYFAALPERCCVWTERTLSHHFAVDHAMPFALWRNNDLWNLFPADTTANQRKSDRLPTYDLLQRRRDRIVHYWQGLHEALDERFSREAQTLLGRDRFQAHNWENRLFTRFVEAFEITASQRGADRWDPDPATHKVTTPAKLASPPKRPPYPEQEERIYGFEPTPAQRPTLPEAEIRSFHALNGGAYRTHLPIVASLAAGEAFHGFATENLAHAEDLDWIPVSPALIRPRRFVVRVDGDSMEPTLRRGQYLVFEYHRSPRREGEIVIASIPAFGPATDGTEAIKRIRQSRTHWIFESDNPDYPPFSVPKEEVSQPILGCYVGAR